MLPILELLKEKVLISDGAAGTMFYARGLDPSCCYENLNIADPGSVDNLHRLYISAGADIIETNSFSANASQLSKFGYENKVSVINEAAAVIARKAAAGSVYVAGSVGPLNKSYLSDSPDEMRIADIYREQVLALARGGVDLFILETFSDLEQIKIALRVCKEETSLPVIASMSFPDGRRTSFGYGIAASAKAFSEGGADIIGINCGSGPVMAHEAAGILAGLTDKFISVQPNAGYPEVVDGRSIYLSSPEYFIRHALAMVDLGVNIIGGCCGTTPEYIRMLKDALDERGRKPSGRRSSVAGQNTVVRRNEVFLLDKEEKGPKIIVELLPPKHADGDKLIDTAAMLKSSGARLLSFPENPLAQVRMSSIAAAGLVKQKTALETVFHYTCRDRNLINLQSDILGAYALGLRYVLAVTGDPASLGNTPGASSVYDIDSIKLVKLIDNMKKSFGLDMTVGVAFNPNFDDISGQLGRLKRKVLAGAEFVMTQPVFDVKKIKDMASEAASLNVPVYLGVLPLVSKRNAEFLHNEVPGMRIPDEIRRRMDIEDPILAKHEGVSIALEIMDAARSFVRGFYLISPLNKYEISAMILKQVLRQ